MSDELAGVRAGDFNEQKPLPTVEQAIEAAVDRIYALGLFTAKGRHEDIRQRLRIVVMVARLHEHGWHCMMIECDRRKALVADLRREVGDE